MEYLEEEFGQRDSQPITSKASAEDEEMDYALYKGVVKEEGENLMRPVRRMVDGRLRERHLSCNNQLT